MSKAGHPSDVTKATLAKQDAERSLVRAMKAAGASDAEIEAQLVVTAEQDRLIREWSEQ